MRVITGWRYLVYITLPLILAALGAINLSNDLLSRVEAAGNAAERQRNALMLAEAVASVEADLVRLVTENARWDEASRNTSGEVNATWFAETWGNGLALSDSYDMVAVLDQSNGRLLQSQARNGSAPDLLALLGGEGFASYKQVFENRKQHDAVVSGIQPTSKGMVAVAMAPIKTSAAATSSNDRVLYFARILDGNWLQALMRRLMVDGLVIMPGSVNSADAIALKSMDGQVVASLTWSNTMVGELLTASSWTKASIVLSFLMLVLAGIGYVCWSLVQQLLEDEHRAQHNALHDHLTGLPNRLALMRSMDELQAKQQTYTLAFADLDGFKEVNDSYGHEYGDKLISMVAQNIRSIATQAKLCCRLGGDEFVVLFVGENSLQQAITYAEQVIAAVKQPFEMDGRLASVGASVGIAACDSGQDVSEMMRRADIAMYKAKAAGKGQACVFDDVFDSERQENLAIASELKSIIKAKTLDIVFQPVVHAKTHQITGVEALARWPSLSMRDVPTERFIAIAESAGLINDLGQLVLEKACAAAATWKDVRLAVNISPVQLNNPGFVKQSLAVIEASGLPAGRVEFEITETSLIHDTERAKEVFGLLQRAGVKIALDDFGAGFSSIGYLRTFQFDRIKIDKSIVKKVLSNPSELAVLQGTLLVARGLSADVTAEGVESDEVASLLRLAGCTELQGYLYHRALTSREIVQCLSRDTADGRAHQVIV